MQPNFTEQSDANIKKKLHTCFSPIAKKSKIKTVLSFFKYRLSKIIRTFMSLRAMKLGCIREKSKKNFVFPLICTNFVSDY